MSFMDLRPRNLAGRLGAETIARDKALYEIALCSFLKVAGSYAEALGRHRRRELMRICRRNRGVR